MDKTMKPTTKLETEDRIFFWIAHPLAAILLIGEVLQVIINAAEGRPVIATVHAVLAVALVVGQFALVRMRRAIKAGTL